MAVIRVGILGFSRREGIFSEVGLRSWEEAGCAAVEAGLMAGPEPLYTVHRPLVIRIARPAVERILRDWCDGPHPPSRCHLVFTVGAAGYSPADVVPDVTRKLLTCPAPGLAELVRRAAADAGFPQDAATRGLAGFRRRTLIVNLPGNLQGHAHPAPLHAAARALLPVLPALFADLPPEC